MTFGCDDLTFVFDEQYLGTSSYHLPFLRLIFRGPPYTLMKTWTRQARR